MFLEILLCSFDQINFTPANSVQPLARSFARARAQRQDAVVDELQLLLARSDSAHVTRGNQLDCRRIIKSA